MSDTLLIKDFLTPLPLDVILGDEELNEAQLGNHIFFYAQEFPDVQAADVVLVGIGEERGTGNGISDSQAPDLVRKHLYSLYNWHPDVQLADVGTIKPGASLADTYAAARSVIAELLAHKKKVIVLGGSHDLTLAQYGAYAEHQQIIEASCVDAFINLGTGTALRSENFLMEMLTGEPNFIRHYNHIGFQSYFVHPNMLQTMDKLRFDCYRLGVAKEQLDEMEPVLRNSHMLSIDVAAMSHSAAPANRTSPNGFNGEEMCTLTRFAGMGERLNSLGIYGYNPNNDVHELTAIQIAHMIWYFVDGVSKSKTEAQFSDRHAFNELNAWEIEPFSIFFARVNHNHIKIGRNREICNVKR